MGRDLHYNRWLRSLAYILVELHIASEPRHSSSPKYRFDNGNQHQSYDGRVLGGEGCYTQELKPIEQQFRLQLFDR